MEDETYTVVRKHLASVKRGGPSRGSKEQSEVKRCLKCRADICRHWLRCQRCGGGI